MKILVTGGRGFIGRNLVKYLLAYPQDTIQLVCCSKSIAPNSTNQSYINGIDYREVHCNIDCDRQCAYMLGTHKPDIIFHLAGNPLVKLSEQDPYGFRLCHTNIAGTHNLLAHAPAGCRFVLASSASVYGNAGARFSCHEDHAPEPTSIYGASKLAAEALVQGFSGLDKVSGVILRYVANVGPYSTHGVLRDVIRKLKESNPVLELIGKQPGSIKPYCHVLDTVRATVLLGFSDKRGIWNVTPNNSISIKQLAEQTMKALNIHKDIKWLGAAANWPGDNPIVRTSNSKLLSLDWQLNHSLSGDAVYHATKEIGELR